MTDLNGKRILFFSAKAFDIPENIVTTMKRFGAIVDFYDERPANTFIVKALIRLNRKLIAQYINLYHSKIIEETKLNKYDYIFFIKGESFSERNLKKLFSFHPESKTIIYHWDSIANNANALNLLKHFNRAFSFDKFDCDRYGIKFLPLFYFDEYKEIANYQELPIYDLMFVGTTHSDRYRFITSIVSQIEKYGGKCFTYFFFQGKIMFYRYKLLNKEIRGKSIRNFHFVPLAKNKLIELYKESRIIVDIQHPKQTGLTLRCFEALGANRKLITTNPQIVNYDFYTPENILVVNRKSPFIDESFLKTPYKKLKDEIYDKYSISSWVCNIFSE